MCDEGLQSSSGMEPLCSGHRFSLPGRGVGHPLPSSVEVKESSYSYVYTSTPALRLHGRLCGELGIRKFLCTNDDLL